jgi:hypothetical protein
VKSKLKKSARRKAVKLTAASIQKNWNTVKAKAKALGL